MTDKIKTFENIGQFTEEENKIYKKVLEQVKGLSTDKATEILNVAMRQVDSFSIVKFN